MRKATKTIISFAVVLIAGLNFIIPAFAQDPFTAIAVGGLSGASAGGLFSSMAAMSGVNIAFPSGGIDPLDAMYNVQNPDYVLFHGTKHEASNVGEDVYDYITVDIGDWLAAQSDFIVELISNEDIQDNDSGTINVPASWEGITFPNRISAAEYQSDVIATVNVSGDGTYTITDGRTTCTFTVTNWPYGSVYIECDGISNTYTGVSFREDTYSLRYRALFFSDPGQVQPIVGPSTNSSQFGTSYVGQTTSATNIPWTSTTVNENVFNGWEAAKVKIPSSISGLSPNWDIPDFLDAINDIWSRNQQGQIVIEDTDQPVPPPVPVPTTPLGEVPFDDWIDLWGQGIYQQLENQSDTLDLIGSNGIDAIEELESIDTNTEDLVEVAESIDTNIGVGNGILGGIRSLAQSAVNYLEGIAEHVGELVEEIVAGTETLIAGILNQIPQAFGVIFGPIKQASSIWHYVVEWITSIGAPFQFIWSMASGTSYYVILPVYASLAAAVVLAFFKRFGR